jgi:hypothetical protein
MSILLVRRSVLAAMVGMILTAGAATSASAAGGATKGTLFFNGGIHTVVVPAALPNGGVDPFCKVTNGAAGQLGIAAVAPGSGDYQGGAWAVSLVTFKSAVAPYLLMSAQAVLSAQQKGNLTVVRRPDLDFRCPVQP